MNIFVLKFKYLYLLGTVTYGVLKVEEETVPQLAIPTFTSASVPQLVTSNINGQLYVISNASDVFVSHQATTGTRPIVPRATMVESTPVVPVTSNKKVKVNYNKHFHISTLKIYVFRGTNVEEQPTMKWSVVGVIKLTIGSTSWRRSSPRRPAR